MSAKLGSAKAAAKRRTLPAALAAHCWRPGQSGNPSGLSGEYGEVVRLARLLSVRAVERLGELMESEDERVAAVACQAILDRAHGKPRAAPEDVKSSLEERMAAMSDQERHARLIELHARATQVIEGMAREVEAGCGG
jgi:hypothetical protein